MPDNDSGVASATEALRSLVPDLRRPEITEADGDLFLFWGDYAYSYVEMSYDDDFRAYDWCSGNWATGQFHGGVLYDFSDVPSEFLEALRAVVKEDSERGNAVAE